jgi:hypothetical protein
MKSSFCGPPASAGGTRVIFTTGCCGCVRPQPAAAISTASAAARQTRPFARVDAIVFLWDFGGNAFDSNRNRGWGAKEWESFRILTSNRISIPAYSLRGGSITYGRAGLVMASGGVVRWGPSGLGAAETKGVGVDDQPKRAFIASSFPPRDTP